MEQSKHLSEQVKGLSVSVLRDADGHDCTMDGISSKHTQFILFFPNGAEIFQPTSKTPALFAVKRKVCGKDYWTAYPDLESALVANGSKHGHSPYCFGGNFVYTSDGRFPNDYPIPIHDRIETHR